MLHRNKFIIQLIQHMGKDRPASAGRADRDQLHHTRHGCSGRSCSAETAMGFLSASDHHNIQLCCLPCANSQARDAPHALSPRYRQKEQGSEKVSRHQHQRRRARRTTCSETVEDASSTSSAVRLKSKARLRRQRPAHSAPQPYIEKCLRVLVSPGSSVSIFLLRSAHVIVTPNCQLKCEAS